jgi:cell division protein FtsB
MNVADSIWNKLTRVVVLLLLLAVFAGIARKYLPLIQQNVRMRKAVERLEAEVQKEKATKKKLEAEIEALKDPKTVERLIRNTLLYAKPGETVVRFAEPGTNSALYR